MNASTRLKTKTSRNTAERAPQPAGRDSLEGQPRTRRGPAHNTHRHMPDWRCLQFDEELLERGGTRVNPSGLCLNLSSIIILTIP